MVHITFRPEFHFQAIKVVQGRETQSGVQFIGEIVH